MSRQAAEQSVQGRDRWIAAGLFLTTLLLFSRVLGPGYGFVNYDDPDYVTANSHVQAGFNAAGVKWALTAYLLLSVIGFFVAALMSHQHYGFDHEKTVIYYLGDEAQMAFPKLYPQLLQTAHVHTFTMPLVFLPVWIGLSFTAWKTSLKKLFIVGGALSILTYNAAPFALRYGSPQAASLFTVGGVGLFFFYLVSALILLAETWLGLPRNRVR